MRRSLFLVVLLPLAAWPVSAAAGTWSLGPNFGLSVLSNQNASQTVLGWPGDVFGYQPGLRIGFLDRRSPTEFYVDTGLFFESGSGASFRIFQASGNIQFSLSGRSASGAYATGGLGFWMVDDDGTSASVPTLGAGLGARGVLRHGHGAFRGELRFDHFFEDQGAGIDAFNSLGVKFGFDLWMR